MIELGKVTANCELMKCNDRPVNLFIYYNTVYTYTPMWLCEIKSRVDSTDTNENLFTQQHYSLAIVDC
jgi:hypothetical protein